MSNRPSDEILMAYADGALPKGQHADVEAYLAGDPDARRFVEAMRRSSEAAAAAFDAPMHEPAPQRLLDAIMAAPSAAPATTAAPRSRFNNSRRRDWSAGWAMPMAASLALVAGSSFGYVIGRQSASQSGDVPLLALGQVAPASQLAQLLETSPSGAQVDAASGGRRLTIVATFRDRNARPCRELEVLAAGPNALPMSAGIACRSSDARWLVEGAISLALTEGSDRYKPSGAAEKDALDSLVTLLGAGSALGPAEERQLIESGWRKRE